MRFLVALMAAAFCSNLAQAQDLGREFLFQAGEKQRFLQVESVGSSTSLIQGSGGGSFRSTSLNINYEYGFFKNFSAYGNVSHNSGISEGRYSGIGPLVAGAKYSRNIGPGMFFGRINLMANIIGGKLSCGISCDVGDNTISSNLQLAYQWKLKNANTGLSLSYGLFSTDIQRDTGEKMERDGFLTVSAFYERAISDSLWGVALTYIGDAGIVGNATMFPFVYNGFVLADDGIDTDGMALKGYLRTDVTDSVQLVTGAEYTRLIEKKTFSRKTSSMLYSINLRKVF